MADLLIELFSEEIPARMQKRAGEDLKKLVTDGLVEAGLTYESAAAFSTPRRLCLAVSGLTTESPTVSEERKGPRVDAPDKAIQGFLRGAGLTKDQLEIQDSKKGPVYIARIVKPGRRATEIVAEVLPAVIRSFPWPKSMRWGRGTLRWVRPLHSILCVLSDEAGSEVVDFDLNGIKSGNLTAGHRFHAPDPIAVTGFDGYRAALKKAYVMLDPAERADHIWADATNLAFAQGLDVVEDKALLAEVAGLVEWPVVLLGDIAPDFLDLPPEVLQTSMREHQKFFSVRNPKTNRIEKFITVANRETADQGATILAGNQKVLFARLSDARFFWENDLRVARSGMKKWTEALGKVIFHNKLGTQAERIERIAALAREIAPIVGADAELAEQAAKLAKADLSSEMVGEFPELQGLMGRYYAEAAGLPQEVASAAEQHYSPLGPGDVVPTEPVSVAVALADKLDTLTGFWAIDEKPTGSKDPFALRRAALGVIRLVLENGVRVPMDDIIASQFDGFLRQSVLHPELELASKLEESSLLKEEAEVLFASATKLASDLPVLGQIIRRSIKEDRGPHSLSSPEIAKASTLWVLKTISEELGGVAFLTLPQKIDPEFEDHSSYLRDAQIVSVELSRLASNLLAFFHDRLKVYLRDQNISHDIIDACLAMPNNDDFTLLVNRARALQDFINTEDGTNLLQGYKRANNILTQAEEKDGVEYSYGADVKFAETDTERALFAALDTTEAAIEPAMLSEDFAAAMSHMASLRAPIDAFFESVQINTDNALIRRNRLNLVSRIRKALSQVADFSKL